MLPTSPCALTLILLGALRGSAGLRREAAAALAIRLVSVVHTLRASGGVALQLCTAVISNHTWDGGGGEGRGGGMFIGIYIVNC